MRTWVQSSSHTLTSLRLDVCLPRLAIHLTASAVQYLHRLRSHTTSPQPTQSTRPTSRRPSHVSDDMQLDSILEGDGPTEPLHPETAAEENTAPPRTRSVTLSFTAPTMALHLHDDLQQRALVDVAVGGLQGRVAAAGPTVTVGLEVRQPRCACLYAHTCVFFLSRRIPFFLISHISCFYGLMGSLC